MSHLDNISSEWMLFSVLESTLSIQKAHQILIIKLKSRLLTQTNQIVQSNYKKKLNIILDPTISPPSSL